MEETKLFEGVYITDYRRQARPAASSADDGASTDNDANIRDAGA